MSVDLTMGKQSKTNNNSPSKSNNDNNSQCSFYSNYNLQNNDLDIEIKKGIIFSNSKENVNLNLLEKKIVSSKVNKRSNSSITNNNQFISKQINAFTDQKEHKAKKR